MSGFRSSDNGRVLIPYGTGKKIVRGILPGEHADDAVTKAQLDAVQEGTVDLSRIEFSESGTAAAPVLTWDGDTNMGLFRSGADVMDFTAAGTSQVQFSDGAITPTTDNDIALGSASKKYSSISLADGLVSALPVRFGADGNNGLYGVSDTQLGVAVEGTLVGGFNTTGLFTDVISEQTSTVGVTIDGALVKDGGISANSMFAAFYPTAAQNNITAGTGGAVSVTNYLTTINTDAGGDAFTLAAGGQIGQVKKILLVVDGGGDGTLTLTGYTSIVFNDATDYVILMWSGAAWFVLENSGCTVNA